MKTTLNDLYVKQLRQDARRLETVAKHLRQLARDAAREARLTKSAASFFAKRSNVDPATILTPFPEDATILTPFPEDD